MQTAIINHCHEIKAMPIITTDHNLVYGKQEKLYICRYSGDKFSEGVEIKDVEKLCNGFMKYLGGNCERD